MTNIAPEVPLTPKMELVQDRLRRPLDGWLREAHWGRRLSFRGIAAELEQTFGVRVGLSSLTDWFRRYGIPTRRDPDREAVA